MGIDQNKASEMIHGLERNFQTVAGLLPRRLHGRFRVEALSTALAEAVKLVEGSRSPVFYVSGGKPQGREGLLHALTGRRVKVRIPKGAAAPGSTRCVVSFPERNATWDFVLAHDSDPAFLESDFGVQRPDVWLHVLPANLAAAGVAEAGRLVESIDAWGRQAGRRVPVVFVLGHADQLASKGAWPPEEHAQTAGSLQSLLEAFRNLAPGAGPVDLNFPYRGLVFGPTHETAVLPLGGGDGWNADVLQRVLGERLPENTLIHFYQAIGREEQLRLLAQSVTRRFAAMAAGIGATPLPMADVLVLTPLQFLLIAIVGGLAGRPVSRATVFEYLGAAGIGVGAGYVARQVARQSLKFIPLAGHLVSGAIAGGATYGLGRAAEAYFFTGEIKSTAAFEKEFTSTITD